MVPVGLTTVFAAVPAVLAPEAVTLASPWSIQVEVNSTVMEAVV